MIKIIIGELRCSDFRDTGVPSEKTFKITVDDSGELTATENIEE